MTACFPHAPWVVAELLACPGGVIGGKGPSPVGLRVAAEPAPIPAGPCSVFQSSINSLKKGPKLLKWFPTSRLPQRTLRPQPRIPQAGRSRSGQRMPSLPCELSCGWAPPPNGRSPLAPGPHQALATPPIPRPHLILRCCVSMETPLCLLPGLPLIGPSFSHLLFGRWDSVTAAAAPQPLPSCSLCLFPPGRAGDWPSARQDQPFGAVPEQFLWSLAHREGAQTPATCPAQQASPALLCPPWSQKGQVCSCGLGLTPHCHSLTSISISIGSVVPGGGTSHLPPA